MSKLDTDAAFAAGLISFAGSFMMASAGGLDRGKVVRFVLRSVNRGAAIERLAEIAGTEFSSTKINGKEALGITIQGETLHRLMKTLWPYLPKDRQQDYARARLKAKAARKANTHGVLSQKIAAKGIAKGITDPKV